MRQPVSTRRPPCPEILLLSCQPRSACSISAPPPSADCDANTVCGVPCVEIDLMEANKVAFVSTVHVGDDPNGEGFGIAHYVTKKDKRLRSERGDDCAYGPRESCTIDTNRKFTATFSFSSAGAQFGYSLKLEQDGGQRRATLGTQLVRYIGKPGKGNVGSADEANEVLAKALASGMTLVVSHCESLPAQAWIPLHPFLSATLTLLAPCSRPATRLLP